LAGGTGIAHTRWATHGVPSVENAHPHMYKEKFALVHNGIIENHEALREQQRRHGFEFETDTDTEVIVNQIEYYLRNDREFLNAVFKTIGDLRGAYALGIISADDPGRLIAVRSGSPLVVGVGIGEYFIASDIFALLPVTQKFMVLEEGDVADIRRDELHIYDKQQRTASRPVIVSQQSAESVDKAGYRHYMLKEIFTQPLAVAETLEGRLAHGQVVETAFGMGAGAIFDRVKCVDIVACGTSYHAGLIAKYWLEATAGVPCNVEIASEYRYRRRVVRDQTLFVAISQSGETADTLAALESAKSQNYLSHLAVCNVPESSLTRASELVFLTHAGPEIGVASTKAFTTQLTGLLLLMILLARRRGLPVDQERALVRHVESLPGKINLALDLSQPLSALAEQFTDKRHALYLGRGAMLPVAMEGALKLKEISYIHAEAYAAGELKHGPLALVDDDMPVIAVAPNNQLLEKLKSNLQEVRARGGKLYVFTDTDVDIQSAPDVTMIRLAPMPDGIAPIVYTVPLQLFAYHVAVLKGADIDQPRNLAKAVTVE
jgi:glucosamine--fructose-6-phosphate aminotransferase (isomerizing)